MPSLPRELGHSEVLVYGGVSAWEPEADSLRQILYDHGIGSVELKSDEINAMSLEEMAKHDLMIFPGGNSYDMTNSLTPATHAKLREAVQMYGMSYLGFCAGAWAAIAPAPANPSDDVTFGFGIVDGPVQEFSYLWKQGKHFDIVQSYLPDGSRRYMLWYGGPQTPETPHGVLARYPDKHPAISQIWSGKGLVIVSGLHPAATPAVMNALGLVDPDGPDYDLAWKLLEAALRRDPLPGFEGNP